MKLNNNNNNNFSTAIFREMITDLREEIILKNMKFLEILDGFNQKSDISQMGNFLKEKGYLLYGTKLVNKKYLICLEKKRFIG